MSEGETEQIQIPQAIPEAMTKESIHQGLSKIGKTFDGSSVAYIKLDLKGKAFDVLCEELALYRHLREANLSGNYFTQVKVLEALPCLLRLELGGNRLTSLELFNNPHTFQYLQSLDLSENLIQALSPISLPRLVHLNLKGNKIESAADFKGHTGIRLLELRKNKLTSLHGIGNMSALEELDLAENAITSLEGLHNLGALRKINLRKNAISSFDEESLPELEQISYLNIRENEFVEIIRLGLLKKYRSLARLVIADNPVRAEPSGDVKKECLVALPQIKVLGKEEITAEEREDAIAEAMERMRLAEAAKGEAERLAQEALLNEGDKDPDESLNN